MVIGLYSVCVPLNYPRSQMFCIYGSNLAPLPYRSSRGGGKKNVAHILAPPLDLFLYSPLVIFLNLHSELEFLIRANQTPYCDTQKLSFSLLNSETYHRGSVIFRKSEYFVLNVLVKMH